MSLLGVKVRGRSQLAIEQFAGRARTRLQPEISCLDAVNCLLVFENLIITLGVHPEIRDRGREAGALVCERTKELVVCMHPRTYDDLERGDARAGFTLCHEVGHVLQHGPELRAASKEPALFARERRHRVFEDSEWQANAFAGALLMPGAGLRILELRGKLDAWLLQETYGVSAQAAAKRLSDYRAGKAFIDEALVSKSVKDVSTKREVRGNFPPR